MNLRKTGHQLFTRAVVRLSVLLLLLNAAAPAQLVLCHETGQQPRLEQALNGQCLSGAVVVCDECTEHDEMPGLSGAQDSAGITAADHRHCAACRDQLIHNNQVVQRAQQLSPTGQAISGGCLYNLASAPLHWLPAGSAALPRPGPDPPPDLDLLITNSTQLLI